MLKNASLLSAGLLLLASCSSGDDGGSGLPGCSTGDAPYVGCWITAGCQSMDNPASNQPVWGHIRYNFALDGNIYNLVRVYTDSSCTGSPVYQQEQFLDLSYVDQGAEVLQSAITAYRLTVQDVDVGPQYDSEVLVHVTSDNRLCLSNNLLLTVDGYTFYFNEDATDIDFNNCLESAG
ncbi:hypothetical protein [Kaarinaea lacus]